MATICPTITADNRIDYQLQLKQALSLSKRIHIDCSDGTLAARKLISLNQLVWPRDSQVDIHLMSLKPKINMLNLLVEKPQLIILHAEADVDFSLFANQLHKSAIRFGLALLEATKVQVIKDKLPYLDHLLIFSGNLGYQGGSIANLDLLDKALYLKQNKPNIEIGWDGGINYSNIVEIAKSGIDILNVGGFIQRSVNPKLAYAKLELLV